MKGLKIGGGIFILWLLFTAFYPKQENSPDSEEIKELKILVLKARTSVEFVNGKTDPFVKELFIEKEAKKLEITSDAYRRLLNLQKSNADILPDIKRDNFWSPIIWFYQDLAPSDRLKLTGGWFLWIFSILPNLTILYVGWKFLQEIPQREKQEKYQAWLVIHSAHGQKVSGARIAALEDLVEQGESLADLNLEKGAKLSFANLEGAKLQYANLEGVEMIDANLNKATLFRVNFRGATLYRTKLRSSGLQFAKLEGANLHKADLEGAKYLTREQLNESYLCETKLPEDLMDLSNRNCGENIDEWMQNWIEKQNQQDKD